MKETVVHVMTIEEWKSVLDVWFGQGYDWPLCKGRNDYGEKFYYDGSRQLGLNANGFAEITCWSLNDYDGDNLIEYTDFMAHQKEGNKIETYYVTQEQLDAIKELNDSPWPTNRLLVNSDEHIIDLFYTFNESKDKALLRYLGGDPTIEFKVKYSLYRLWRIDGADDKVYMSFNLFGTPSWTDSKYEAFTASLDEITKWKTPSWSVEEVE